MRLLARRAHSRLELRRKLARRGYGGEEVDGVVARLMQQRYLDDAAFAAGHVRRRSESHGPLAIAAELAARGVDRETADGAVQRLEPGRSLSTAHRIAERLAGGATYGTYRELLHSVGPKLLRRGFSMSVARAACDLIWQGTAEGPHP